MFNKAIIAYDHRVDKKYVEKIKEVLNTKSIEFCEVLNAEEGNDYPLIAKEAYNKYQQNKANLLILLCGTGVGMNIVANKFDGICSVLPADEATAYFARRDEDANCIVFAAGKADENHEVKLCRRKMARMLNVFIDTKFMGEERHLRRINQIRDIEKGK